jgi:hypothetical protein
MGLSEGTFRSFPVAAFICDERERPPDSLRGVKIVLSHASCGKEYRNPVSMED